MKKLFWIMGMLYFLVIARSPSSSWAQAVEWSVQTTNAEFVVGEPVRIIITFKNQSDSPKIIDLGPSGYYNLAMKLSGATLGIIEPRRMELHGFQMGGEMRLNPHSTEEKCIFLEDLVSLSAPDTYDLALSIRDSDLPSVSTKIRIVSWNESWGGALQERYKQNWAIIEAKPSYDSIGDEGNVARRYISLSKNVEALPYQLKMIAGQVDSGFAPELIDSLIASKSPDAIKALVQHVLANPEPNDYQKSYMRDIVLNALREGGAENWPDEIRNIISPYLQDIIKSRPISIDD